MMNRIKSEIQTMKPIGYLLAAMAFLSSTWSAPALCQDSPPPKLTVTISPGAPFQLATVPGHEKVKVEKGKKSTVRLKVSLYPIRVYNGYDLSSKPLNTKELLKGLGNGEPGSKWKEAGFKESHPVFARSLLDYMEQKATMELFTEAESNDEARFAYADSANARRALYVTLPPRLGIGLFDAALLKGAGITTDDIRIIPDGSDKGVKADANNAMQYGHWFVDVFKVSRKDGKAVKAPVYMSRVRVDLTADFTLDLSKGLDTKLFKMSAPDAAFTAAEKPVAQDPNKADSAAKDGAPAPVPQGTDFTALITGLPANGIASFAGRPGVEFTGGFAVPENGPKAMIGVAGYLENDPRPHPPNDPGSWAKRTLGLLVGKTSDSSSTYLLGVTMKFGNIVRPFFGYGFSDSHSNTRRNLMLGAAFNFTDALAGTKPSGQTGQNEFAIDIQQDDVGPGPDSYAVSTDLAVAYLKCTGTFIEPSGQGTTVQPTDTVKWVVFRAGDKEADADADAFRLQDGVTAQVWTIHAKSGAAKRTIKSVEFYKAGPDVATLKKGALPIGTRVPKEWGKDFKVIVDGNEVKPEDGFSFEPGTSHKIEIVEKTM